MSKREKRVAVWVLTHAADYAIRKQGAKYNLLWWQVELLKLAAAFAIAELVEAG